MNAVENHVRIFLTGEQSEQLQPLWAKVQAPMSPDVLVAQIFRSDWQDGGRLFLQFHVIARSTSAAMGEAFRKAQVKRRARENG